MKKIILLIIILFIPIVMADSDNTFHTARMGGNDTYFNSWAGNDNFGQFFDKGFLTIQEQILENIQWFNTALLRNDTLGGALSHIILLASIIGIVTLAEVTINPALMVLAGLSMFFFGWFIILSVSMILGFFMFPFSTIYLVRISSVMNK